MTLIEIAVGLTIFAILLALAAPSFSTWLQNSKIRTTAEAINNGLQLTRAEAVQRNAVVRFQLTTTLTASCALSTADSNWVISLDDPSGACDSTPSDTVAPRIVQTRPAAEGSTNTVIAADQAAIAFNGLGRQSSIGGAPLTTVNINISSATANTRNLRVSVSSGGQTRMCDPALPSTDPQGC
jgi:type IV fimbrial biogenesis protein FimT